MAVALLPLTSDAQSAPGETVVDADRGGAWLTNVGMGERMAAHTYTASRILLVEDSEDLRGLMTLILEAEGYVVDTACTAEEGLHLLNRCSYDLVLSDYALPGRTGAWMLREALAQHLLTQGMIVTAHPNPRDAEGFPVIQKPLDFDVFLQQIRECVNSGRDLSAAAFRAKTPSSPRLQARTAQS